MIEPSNERENIIKGKIAKEVFQLSYGGTSCKYDCIENGRIDFNTPCKYYCRYYYRYFDEFVEDLFDNKKSTAMGLDKISTLLLRRKYGIHLSDSDNQVLMLNRNSGVSHDNVSRILRNRFIDYGISNFVKDIRNDDVNIQDVFLDEVFPYEDKVVQFLALNNILTIADFCKKYYPGNFISDFISEDKGIWGVKKARELAMIHRIHMIGGKFEYEDNYYEPTEEDYFLEQSISCLDLNSRTYRMLRSAGIYTVETLCQLKIQDLGRISGIGPAFRRNIIDAVHNVGLKFCGEGNYSIDELKELSSQLKNLTYERNTALSRLAAIDSEISRISSILGDNEEVVGYAKGKKRS